MRKMLKWIAAMMALAMLLSLTAAFAEPVTPDDNDLTATISVPIQLIGTAPVRDSENPEGYRLKLVAWDDSNPLPAGADLENHEWVSDPVYPDSDSTETIETTITFDNVGIYSYTLSQVVDNPRPSGEMTYDTHQYEVRVTVYRPDRMSDHLKLLLLQK